MGRAREVAGALAGGGSERGWRRLGCWAVERLVFDIAALSELAELAALQLGSHRKGAECVAVKLRWGCSCLLRL